MKNSTATDANTDPYAHDGVLGALHEVQKQLDATVVALDTISWALANAIPIQQPDIAPIVEQTRIARGNLADAKMCLDDERRRGTVAGLVDPRGVPGTKRATRKPAARKVRS